MKSMTASLLEGSLYWPLGLFLSLHNDACKWLRISPDPDMNTSSQEKCVLLFSLLCCVLN